MISFKNHSIYVYMSLKKKIPLIEHCWVSIWCR